MGKTSSEAKQRYNAKHYITVGANLDKELVERFRRAVARRGDTISGVFRAAIESYLAKSESEVE